MCGPWRYFRALLGLTVLLSATPHIALGQALVTVAAGPAQYDLSGTGWSGSAEVHVEFRLKSWLGLEAGSGVFWYRTQADRDVAMLLPEVGLRAHSDGPIPVYVAAGVGHTLELKNRRHDESTIFSAVGLSINLRQAWRLRPELRIRLTDFGTGGIGTYTLGFSRQLGP